MDGGSEPRLEVITSLADVTAAEWDACAGTLQRRPANPFVSWRFLMALEASGSTGGRSGWQACHLIARRDGRVLGVMPLYSKSHSQGEYVFDHAWAEAWENAGGAYYPKLQAAVPFTPVTGPRLLTREAHQDIRALLLRGAEEVARRHAMSSLHLTFCSRAEFEAGPDWGLLQRLGQQYHWFNRGYGSFDDFLAALTSRKRKAIRHERLAAQGFGGRILALTGDDLKSEHWDAFWRFYQDTGSRKWGRPYLTRSFFQQIHERMRDEILLILAERDGTYVAGALNFIGSDALFGRYWGCIEDHPFLHFELCYHQAIDFAIKTRLSRVEAGAQGEHKLARGYGPVPTYSLHWFADSRLRDAVRDYLALERTAVAAGIADIGRMGPFRRGEGDEQAG
jgi:hypothetical protein